MANEVSLNEKFKDRVTKRMKAVFQEMMPESEIEDFCRKQLEHFQQNDMEDVAKAMIREEFKRLFSSQLNGLAQEMYNADTQQVEISDSLKKLLVEAAPDMFRNFIQGEARTLLYSYHQQVGNGLNYNGY